MKRFSLSILLLWTALPGSSQQTYAVIVGVADYQNLRSDRGDLHYADDDALLVSRFLRSPQGGSVPANHIITLTNSQATHANILQALHIFERARPNDRVIFHFSGHGNTGVFFPYDAPTGQLYHQELKAAFKQSAAKTKIVWADACLSGSLKRRTNARPVGQTSQHLTDPSLNIVVMTSSRYNQNSIETSDLHQGFFTYYLVKGAAGEADLNHNGVITVREHYQYVRNQVALSTNNRQIPIIYGRFSDNMPITRL